MKASRGILALLLVCGLAGWGRADVLILKDGQAITGKYQGGDPGGITFLVDGQYRRYAVTDVHSLTILPAASTTTSSAPAPAPTQAPTYSSGRSTQPPAPAPSNQPAPYPPSNPSSGGGGYSTRTATPTSSTPQSMGVSIPAGTTLTVRLIDPVDSSVNQIGETFRASLDEPLVVGGRTIAARGANVTTKLVSVEEAGRISGRSELALVLYDVTINGRKYEITTEEVSQQGSSRGQQSATRISGLAAIGAVIGAIAGGGKGAAQGAAAGAGAGTAVQVLTHGDNVQIPAESRLDFTLAKPLDL
jgi:hypothetical protein